MQCIAYGMFVCDNSIMVGENLTDDASNPKVCLLSGSAKKYMKVYNKK